MTTDDISVSWSSYLINTNCQLSIKLVKITCFDQQLMTFAFARISITGSVAAANVASYLCIVTHYNPIPLNHWHLNKPFRVETMPKAHKFLYAFMLSYPHTLYAHKHARTDARMHTYKHTKPPCLQTISVSCFTQPCTILPDVSTFYYASNNECKNI